ncbi:unnamed protein product [Auanema sp. JU1783]|nr:unnamed protein product [Auanema sp. JU1783]
MVITKEFRINLPMTVDDFERGQLYAVAHCSKNETGGGEGAQFLKQEEFTSDDIVPGKRLNGTYTYKLYKLRSKAPWFMQKVLPPEAFEVHEESWNAYPYCKTVITNPGYMKNNFKVVIESLHLPDDGTSPNPLQAKESRDIHVIDICDDAFLHKDDYNEVLDPKIFKSKSTGIGPLAPKWAQTTKPIMCAYKLVTVHFKWTGLGSLIEKSIMKQYPRIFGKLHRESWCWIDDWYSMSMDSIRMMEEKIAQILEGQILEENRRGTTCNDSTDPRTGERA